MIANPRQVTRVLVPFGGTSSLGTSSVPAGYTGPTSAVTGGARPGTFVWHCHILEHEENDMMQAMVIKP